MKKLLIPILTLLLLAACQHGKLPQGVMSKEKMVDFLTDAYLLEGFYAIETQYRYDVLPEHVLASYDSILRVHSLSREDVERSFDYYTHDLTLYQQIQDSVVARLEAKVEPQSPTSAAPQTEIIPNDDTLRPSIPRLLKKKQ